MMREPEKLAALKMGASSGETSKPEETTGPNRLAFDRSAPVKFARMIQARSSLAPERLAPERSAPSSFAPKRFALDKLARLKSTLLRSRFSSDLPAKSAGFSGDAAARISRICVALRSPLGTGSTVVIGSFADAHPSVPSRYQKARVYPQLAARFVAFQLIQQFAWQ